MKKRMLWKQDGAHIHINFSNSSKLSHSCFCLVKEVRICCDVLIIDEYTINMYALRY